MITQEEYEEAQELVWDYEDQLKEQGKAFDTSEETALNIDLVSECKKLDIHKCLNDIMEITDRRLGIFGVVRGSLRYEYKKAIDKMICCR